MTYYYQAVRISVNGIPTYGDKYRRISSQTELKLNEIVSTTRNERVLILFEEERV